MSQQRTRNWLQHRPRIQKLVRVMYYSIYKRHFYGLTSPLRTLPDFIVIGVVRGGTTSLFENLAKHPCIYSSAYDELGFFDVNYHLGISWYKSLFPSIFTKRLVEFRRRYFMTYDVTPQYIYNKTAARRISHVLPNVKIIALLRNPVDRAYSNYYLGIRDGVEKLSFKDAIAAEMEYLERRKILDLDEYNRPRSYIAKGFYAEQLRIWFELFPKEQILLLASEEFSKEPNKVMNQIFRFLGLPPFEMKNFEKSNIGKYLPMQDDLRKLLVDYFKPYNEELYRLTGKNFGWDKQ